MKAYDFLAGRFDEIFPVGRDRIDFIADMLISGARCVDAGCATGGLAIGLNDLGFEVVGIDLSERMIELARANAGAGRRGLEFRVMDMRRLPELGAADCVLCFGNTLPHLESRDEARAFFASVRGMLNAGGFLAFQIVNFDKVLAEGGACFPTVEKEDFVFKRSYTFRVDGRVDFRIEIEDKVEGRKYEDATPLLVLRQAELIADLRGSGFPSIEAYSDYDRKPSDLNEFATIYSCRIGMGTRHEPA